MSWCLEKDEKNKKRPGFAVLVPPPALEGNKKCKAIFGHQIRFETGLVAAKKSSSLERERNGIKTIK